ncbi:DUF378 domain-containing protein [Lentibacillus halophilus]|uniref:DUF378 domain-containing protein n=1 Tax=Lentibacillus halophilus TaxID=295065 RepID=A0ABN0Z1T8_9BACI
MSGFHRFCLALVIIGAINWGLIGLFQFDLVAAIFGGGEQSGVIARVIYTLVGIGGLFSLTLLFRTDEAFGVDRRAQTDDA